MPWKCTWAKSAANGGAAKYVGQKAGNVASSSAANHHTAVRCITFLPCFAAL